jgi:6-phosphogluconate dehydrogenase
VTLGFVGLGRMGGSMVTRLVRDGHDVVVYDRAAAAIAHAAASGARPAESLAALVAALSPPRAIWLMLPAGAATESVIRELAGLLSAGDTLIDGGNTHYKDDLRRARELATRRLAYVDVGTSGGVWGLEHGYCLMVGGEREAVARLTPVFASLAPPGGWLHVGATGAGHYVKMVHNGIEYGLMQSYAEGFELMAAADYDLDLPAIAQLWNRGSVIRSWLLELAADSLASDPRLEGVKPYVEDSGEGRWTIADAIERAVPVPVITAALYARFDSRRENSFADRLLAALRNAFGGHAVRR